MTNWLPGCFREYVPNESCAISVKILIESVFWHWACSVKLKKKKKKTFIFPFLQIPGYIGKNVCLGDDTIIHFLYYRFILFDRNKNDVNDITLYSRLHTHTYNIKAHSDGAALTLDDTAVRKSVTITYIF